MDATRLSLSLTLILMVLLLSSLSVLCFPGRLPLSLSSPSMKATGTRAMTRQQQTPKRSFDDDTSSNGLSPYKQHQHAKKKKKNHHERTVVIAYHKPANTITSHADDNAIIAATKKGGPRRKTVYDDILSMQGWKLSTSSISTKVLDGNKDDSDMMKKNDISFQKVTGIYSKLHAIGRLDCDTTGLLLLTNDGGLVHHVTNPAASKTTDTSKSSSSKITKTYEAVVMGYHENDCPAFEQMRQEGVDIGAKYGGMTQPVDNLQVLDHPTHKSTLVSLTISEGRNRQVRRMFHNIGSGVMKLQRVQIGPLLTLKGLEEAGQWRIMPDEEVEATLGWTVRDLVNKEGLFKRGSVGEGTKQNQSIQQQRGQQWGSGAGRQPSRKHPKSGRRRRT